MTNNKIKSIQKIHRYYSNGLQKKNFNTSKYFTSKNIILSTVGILITLFIIHVFLLTLSTENSSISSEIQTPFHCKLASFIDYFCFTNFHDHYECIQSYSHRFVAVFRYELYRVANFILKLPLLILSVSIDTFAFFGELLAYSLSELGDNCGKNMKLLRSFADSIV
uniref:G-protein coupled receptors family 1 profile domain-containing protein n=1 Tax=Strongyloides stercoralis TaxID=6248 RepID=A0A0K0ENN6_STRER